MTSANEPTSYTRYTSKAAMRARSLCAVLALNLYLELPASAQPAAESAPVPAQLRLDGGAGCVDRADVEREIRVRSTRVQIVDTRAGIPELQVEVKRTQRVVRVGMNVTWPDGRRSRRELSADTCDEAETAVAFLIALTLDPTAREPAAGEGAAANSDGAEPPATTPASPTPDTAPASEAGPTAASTAPTSSAADSGELDTPEPASAPDSERAFFSPDLLELSFGGQLHVGAAPHFMYGLALHASLPFHGSGRWKPAIRLSAARVWYSNWIEPAGVADFQLSTVQLDLCPLGMQAGPLTARACAGAAVGSLTAQGSKSYAPRDSHRLWADFGSSLLLSLSLAPFLQLEAGAGVAAPLRRDHFAFRPDVFHTVAALCWEAQIGLGVRFP